MKNIDLLVKSLSFYKNSPKFLMNFMDCFTYNHLKADFPELFKNNFSNPSLIKHNIYEDSEISLKVLEWNKNIERVKCNGENDEY